MKITEIKTFPLKAARDIFVVKVETDEGIYGLGEGGCSSRELAESEAVKHFSRFLIGMDPMRIEHIWQKCYRSNYHEGGRVLTGAISAIDIALWDIMGKKLGVPVYQLLGGACRERVFGFPTVSMSNPDCLAICQERIDEGWPCLRLGATTPIPGWAKALHEADPDAGNMFEPRASIAETVEILGELRAKLDKAIPLGVEYHHRLSVAEAAAFCQQAPIGSMAFLEEPIRDETPEAYAMLRQMTGVPFAIGEEWSSKWQARPYIEQGLTNFCRLDVSNIGGLTEAMKVAGWSEAHYIDIMPHNPLGAVCTAATVHMCFAVNNFAWVEFNAGINESAPDIFPVMLERDGPSFPLPTRPGLGVEFDEIAAAAHPHSLTDMPHFHKPDGSHTNW
ncbi:MAG: mandelate racemase/muconate lactonizing enzyme family protein [Caldilineaceae bacterium]|nr:mandelate racemase/muconate lactonizing enzyme family protein [Caldilineaceae bacterium]